MKTVQQWIDEYLSPEEREKFVEQLKEREPHSWGNTLSTRFREFSDAMYFATLFWSVASVTWREIGKRTEPYKSQESKETDDTIHKCSICGKEAKYAVVRFSTDKDAESTLYCKEHNPSSNRPPSETRIVEYEVQSDWREEDHAVYACLYSIKGTAYDNFNDLNMMHRLTPRPVIGSPLNWND